MRIMATKKKEISKAKGVTQKEFIPVAVAIIGLVGVLGSALIAILPNLIRNSGKEIFATQTSTAPIDFHVYDDPLGIFSIRLPPNFVITSRNSETSKISISFQTKEIDKNNIQSVDLKDVVTGNVSASILDTPIVKSDVDFVNESTLMDALGENSFGKRTLIFSQKTQKGYFMKLDEVGKSGHLSIYYLFEYEGKAYILVTIITNEKSDPLYNEMVEQVITNFKWSSEKVLQHLSSP